MGVEVTIDVNAKVDIHIWKAYCSCGENLKILSAEIDKYDDITIRLEEHECIQKEEE